MDAAKRNHYIEAFNAFLPKEDKGKPQNERVLSADSMRLLLHGLVHDHTDENFKEWTKEGARVSLADFLVFMDRQHGVGAKRKQRGNVAEYVSVFNVFDRNSDGFISRLEMRGIFRSLGLELSEEEAKEMFDIADMDGDGLISLEDYVNFNDSMNSMGIENEMEADALPQASASSSAPAPPPAPSLAPAPAPPASSGASFERRGEVTGVEPVVVM